MLALWKLLPAVVIALFPLTGCMSDQTMNPAFPVSLDEAREHLDEMRQNPKPLERPVVVAAGFLDPGVISRNVARRLKDVTSDDAPITSISFFWSFSSDACRDRLIAHVQREYPNDDPNLTTEVDIIGFSMGGLVARHAATPREDGPQLNMVRLFTFGTPHRGARLAPLATFDPRVRDMKAESAFIAKLDQDLAHGRYELFPYVRTRDAVVGEWNAAPPGREPWWVPNKPWSLSHNMAGADERLIADIARRLRGERPLTVDRRPESVRQGVGSGV